MITSVTDGNWEVAATRNTGYKYFVERMHFISCPSNPCSLYCSLCNICIHNFKCSCTDNVIIRLNILCKHIHAIQNKFGSNIADFIENNLVQKENQHQY